MQMQIAMRLRGLACLIVMTLDGRRVQYMMQILLMPWTHRSGSVDGHELRTAWRRSAVEQTPGSTAVMKRSLCRRASGVHQACMQVPSTVRQADGLGCAR